jgi:hypothetical protein
MSNPRYYMSSPRYYGGAVGGGACFNCGGTLLNGVVHHCTTAPRIVPQWSIQQTPSPWQIVACPVCQGRMTVPAGFYSHGSGVTSTAPEPCQSCDGRGLLKMSTVNGAVEKLPPA